MSRNQKNTYGRKQVKDDYIPEDRIRICVDLHVRKGGTKLSKLQKASLEEAVQTILVLKEKYGDNSK